MEMDEPGGLAEIRTLAGSLEVEVLHGVVLFGRGGEGEFIVFVVFGD